MRIFSLATKVVVFLLLLGFAIKNTDSVTLRYFAGLEWQAPLAFVLLLVLAIGIVAGILGTAAGLYFAAMGGAVDHLLVGFQSYFLCPKPLDAFISSLFYFAIAIGLTTLLAWLAAIVPAIRGAFSAQRVLLASGRG